LLAFVTKFVLRKQYTTLYTIMVMDNTNVSFWDLPLILKLGLGWLHRWLSGNALVLINVVTLHRARLIFGWVTVCGQVTVTRITYTVLVEMLNPAQSINQSVGR